MTLIVSFVSQKGGVGKTTLARALAVLLTNSGYSVRIADLDPQQETAKLWAAKRAENDLEPAIDVRGYANSRAALAESDDVDFLLMDGPARATGDTTAISGVSHLVIQPTSGSRDDTNPAAALYTILEEQGIPRDKLVIALTRVTADSEEREAREYFEALGYRVLEGDIRARRSYNQAMNDGGTILETVYDTLNESSEQLLGALVDVIAEQLEQPKPKQKAKAKAQTKTVSTA